MAGSASLRLVSRTQSPVSRAHDRLGAALVRFAVTGHLREQRVIDVSASTPGYVAPLLERGVSHVGALDVGPSPVAPKLREDPRVAIGERAALKSLPASVLPGPFVFFTLDVRFISSRSALRALALRLSEGASGLVWLKPKFEVPAEQQRAAGTNLRELGQKLFREKAASLGFEILATVEVDTDEVGELLLHVVYRGRPART